MAKQTWKTYERRKLRAIKGALSPQEYEAQIKEIAKKLKV